MSNGINKVILIGRLGDDPTTRYMPSGVAITNISIATSEQWKDKQTGEKKEATEWHNIVFFNRLAEIAGQYLNKGSLVYIEGKLKTEKYTDKQGVEKYSTKIIANELQMLGGKGDSKPARNSADEPSKPDTPQGDSGFDDLENLPF